MMCKFCIGRRFSIDNLRIVDWLDNFRNTDFLQNCLQFENIIQLNEEGREASNPLRMSFRLYTSEAMGAQNYYYLAAPGGHGTWKGAGAASSFAQKRSESDKKMVLWGSTLDFLSVSESICHSFLLWENVI